MQNRNSKIQLISFLAAICVIWWHCYCGSTIERWIIPFCYWAVPWFFGVSGYFIVGSSDKRSSWGFVKSKIYSLLFPYVLWCLLGVGVFALCSSEPITLSLADIFALNSHTQPMYNKPLWYIRALMIFSAITMVVLSFLSIVRMRKGFLRVALFSALFLIIYVGLVKMGASIGPDSSALYFVAGAVASSLMEVARQKLFISKKNSIAIAIIALLVAAVFRGVWFATGHSFSAEGQGGVVLGNLSTIFVIVALIYASALISDGALARIASWQGGGGY